MALGGAAATIAIPKGHYLTVKTGEIPNVRKVYEAFKTHARSPEIAEAGVDALAADIHNFADYYCAMALGQESDRLLAADFRDLRELKVDVAYPFLLELYHDYKGNLLLTEDFNFPHIRLWLHAFGHKVGILDVPVFSVYWSMQLCYLWDSWVFSLTGCF